MSDLSALDVGDLTELGRETIRTRDKIVIKLHVEGWSQQAIADKAHLSRCAIQNIIRRESAS